MLIVQIIPDIKINNVVDVTGIIQTNTINS